MSKTISTFFTDNDKGYCKVRLAGPKLFEIEYYDNQGHLFFVEEYRKETLTEVENIAEEWVLGYHKLDIETELHHEV